MTRREFFLLTLTSAVFAESEFEKFLSGNGSDGFQAYKKSIEDEFKDYKKAYDEEFNKYKKEVGANWNEPKLTDATTYVNYSKDLKSRVSVDYENETITLEAQGKTPKDSAKIIKDQLNNLLQQDTKDAFKQDRIIQNVEKRTRNLKKIETGTPDNTPMISDMVSKEEMDGLLKSSKKEILQDKKPTVKVTIKLPKNSLRKKASRFTPTVLKYAQKEKIDPALVMAIMHSESSFNPMARSHVPAFGLMQIVPRSAGRDSYKYLKGYDKLLSSSYLYNSNNNIEIGCAYLHILTYRYLKHIKDPKSRNYCVIAAYNTGAGNVSKTFAGHTNIFRASKIINKLTPQQVYDKLIRDLPYVETKNYLKKVTNRVEFYS